MSAASAAALGIFAACGGGAAKKEGAAPGRPVKPQDTTKQARPGGTFRSVTTADATDFSPAINALASRVVTWRAYSRLTSYSTGYLDKPAAVGEALPDLAESWEVSADKLQITFKIRPDARWDARAPTNGRAVDAEDIEFSWKQFLALNGVRANLAHSLSPAAPVDEVRAIDSRTAVMKLAFPMSDIFDAMGLRFWILPREADGGFDPRKEVRGSSPWILSDYQASSSLTFTKNPNWYGKGMSFVEKVEVPVVPEYATRLAQFRAGNIFVTDVRLQDVLPAKREIPSLNMYEGDLPVDVLELRFGLADPDSPFWDVRVRRAISMMIDRDLYASTFASLDAFRAEGFDREVRWNTQGGYNLGFDPRQKEFGPAGKYFSLDVAEAKKLLTAAGYPNGLTTNAYFRTQASADFPQYEAVLGMLADAGVKSSVTNWDTTTDFFPRVVDGHGNFDGIAFNGGAAWPLIDSMVRRYHSNGASFPGFDPAGQDRLKGDPKVDDLALKIRQEFDANKRTELVREEVRYLSDQMYTITPEAGAAPFTLVWPALRNWNTYRAQFWQLAPVETDVYLWIDPTLAPLA